MKTDVMAWAAGNPPNQQPSKETLNHRGIIELVSGLDVYKHTREAYMRAYQALGIDIINRVPTENAPLPTPAGSTRPHPSLPYEYAPLGVYDTVQRTRYLCDTPEDVWSVDPSTIDYHRDLITPVPHPCTIADIRIREQALGEVGLYYPMLYTTAFMWPVETLGWSAFLMAAAMEPERFEQHFLLPMIAQSTRIVSDICRGSSSPFLFVHDDLATKTGPMFNPRWYDAHIFPHYETIFAPAKLAGKKIILVADGNMIRFLPRLVETGIDGLMFECPATPVSAVLDHFGGEGRYAIGGIDTAILTFGSPTDVRTMVFDLWRQVENCQGFAMASSGGLHGNIPLENLAAYFDARAEIGITPGDWRDGFRV